MMLFFIYCLADIVPRPGKILQEIPMLNAQWIVSLQLMPLAVEHEKQKEFFRIGMGGDISPAMRIRSNPSRPEMATLTLVPIESFTGADDMIVEIIEKISYDVEDVRIGEWTTVEIAQLADGDHYNVTIRINGDIVSSEININPYSLMNLAMTASDEEYETADVLLKHIRVMTFSESLGTCVETGSQFNCTCADNCITENDQYLTTCVPAFYESFNSTIKNIMPSTQQCSPGGRK